MTETAIIRDRATVSLPPSHSHVQEPAWFGSASLRSTTFRPCDNDVLFCPPQIRPIHLVNTNGMVRRLYPASSLGIRGEQGDIPLQLRTIGIDLGKTVFHLVGLNQRGEVVVRKQFSRQQLLHFTANLQVELIGMEACGGSHFLGRAEPEPVIRRCCLQACRSIPDAGATLSDPIRRPGPESATLCSPSFFPGY